jgi:PilZ domain
MAQVRRTWDGLTCLFLTMEETKLWQGSCYLDRSGGAGNNHAQAKPMFTKYDKKSPKESDITERRRSKRIPLSFPIEVSGTDRTGRSFHDQAMTSDVSEQGCSFNLLREVAPGALLEIRIFNPRGESSHEGKPLTYQVVWIEPSPVGWVVGVAQLEPGNFWHINFPSGNPSGNLSR